MLSTSRLQILRNIFIIVGFVASFIIIFFAGFYLKSLLTPEPILYQTTVPIPTPKLNYSPGAHFIEDGFYLLTTDSSSIGIVGSVSRREENNSFTQSTRISLLDSKKPIRYTHRTAASTATISPDPYITNWQTTVDPSRVLKESSRINLTLDSKTYSITTSELQNEIPIRSMPGYTKLFSNGSATLTFDNISHPARILYYRLYSLNANDIYFYSTPLGITTDLMVFWDTTGNVYLLDSTLVDRPVANYQSHAVGFQSLVSGTVSRTFSSTVTRDKNLPPKTYSVTLNSPIDATISFSTHTTLDKSSSQEKWFLSTTTGTILQNGITTPGLGVIEYLRD